MSTSEPKIPTVVITGFGPFSGHPVNASWEAVKLLQSPEIEKELNATIKTQELPVAYKDVLSSVPELWSCSPDLVIHVGVGREGRITIEKKARQTGYTRLDIHNTCPSDGCCKLDCSADNCIETNLNIKELAQSSPEHIQTSEDAGNYLCEFTYFISLSQDRNKALFVHVPPISKPLSSEETAQHLKCIIKGALAQIMGRPSS